MQRRQITLADGRYLIFYTFPESAPAQVETSDAPARVEADNAAPTPAPQAEDERHV
jgi:hypothetical protein